MARTSCIIPIACWDIFAVESTYADSDASPGGRPNAMPCRTVTKKELASNAKARAANDAEWARLRAINGGRGTWREDKVEEWSVVAARHRWADTTAHVGRAFCISVEKNAELGEDDPLRKFKGRVVFQGNNVKDHNWDVAICEFYLCCRCGC